jgi:HSP20 family protein
MTMMMEPFIPLAELQRDFTRLLGANGSNGAFLPAADVLVSDEDVMVRMDVPGLNAEQLEIDLQDDVLSIRGERADPYRGHSGQTTWHRIERAFGRFERTLRLPKGLESDAIDASLVDGVLTIRIAKPEPLKPRRIHISGAGEAHELEDAVT